MAGKGPFNINSKRFRAGLLVALIYVLIKCGSISANIDFVSARALAWVAIPCFIIELVSFILLCWRTPINVPASEMGSLLEVVE